MGELQQFLEEKVLNTPERLIEEFFAKKLAAVGVADADEVARRLSKHLRHGGIADFHWEGEGNAAVSIELEISEADIESLEQRIQQFQKNLPTIVRELSGEVAGTLVRSMKERWREEQRLQFAETKTFRKHLEQRWGKPLGLLRMLLTVAREFNGNAFHGLRKSKARIHRRNVLRRLHVRACQVTAEVISLLESGFADGAMARWRTLHEIGVVATFIADAGEDAAERYVAHRAVEAKQGLDEYLRCYEELGYRPMPKSSAERIIKKFDAAVALYGPEFGRPYGWAAHHLGKKKVTFGDLEDAVGRAEMRSYYKLASYNVHAGPHSAFYRLGLIDGTSGLLGGASNAGLMEPGQNTAHTLTQISALLLSEKSDFDQMVAVRVMEQLRNEIPKAFAKADHKLRQDDKAIKRLSGDHGKSAAH